MSQTSLPNFAEISRSSQPRKLNSKRKNPAAQETLSCSLPDGPKFDFAQSGEGLPETGAHVSKAQAATTSIRYSRLKKRVCPVPGWSSRTPSYSAENCVEGQGGEGVILREACEVGPEPGVRVGRHARPVRYRGSKPPSTRYCNPSFTRSCDASPSFPIGAAGNETDATLVLPLSARTRPRGRRSAHERSARTSSGREIPEGSLEAHRASPPPRSRHARAEVGSAPT